MNERERERGRAGEEQSIKCNKYNYNEDAGEAWEKDVFFPRPCPPPCKRKTRNLLSGRSAGRDRKTSGIIINLADDDKNRHREANYCRAASVMHFPLGRIGTGQRKITNNSLVTLLKRIFASERQRTAMKATIAAKRQDDPRPRVLIFVYGRYRRKSKLCSSKRLFLTLNVSIRLKKLVLSLSQDGWAGGAVDAAVDSFAEISTDTAAAAAFETRSGNRAEISERSPINDLGDSFTSAGHK